MKLLDTNIIIYSYQTQFSYLKPLVIDVTNAISKISYLEILGFHGIQPDEEKFCKAVFKVLPQFAIDDAVITKAVELRRTYKLKLGDSIIAATALLEGRALYTRNVNDFNKIPNLVVVNPII